MEGSKQWGKLGGYRVVHVRNDDDFSGLLVAVVVEVVRGVKTRTYAQGSSNYLCSDYYSQRD